MLEQLKEELYSLADPEKAELAKRFDKTGEGEYGENLKYLGINVPILRKVTKKYELNLKEIQELLNINNQDFKFVALVILEKKYRKENNKKKIFNFYLQNTKNINNWGLVDISAYKIIGDFLFDKNKKVLYDLAESENLWERRIAIVSTFAFIRENKFEDTLAISELLLRDSHDLIHKAVGWMLREVGKRDEEMLKDFLKTHYDNIPRTTLRYAIEKFEENERKKWLRGEFDEH